MNGPATPPRAGTVAAALSDFERFQVHDPLAIAALLRDVMDRRALVTVTFGGGRFFVSALLAVRPERDDIVFDSGPDEDTNERLLASPRVMLAMNVDHIPVQFHAPRPRAVKFQGGAAFAVSFPEAVMRMQRREFYRMLIPPGENTVCEIRRSPADPWPTSLPVHDISCGGVGLEGWPEGQAPESHRIYRNCRLVLGGEVPVVSDLEVMYVLDRTEADGTRVKRCGARFVELPGRQVTHIQRYILGLERRLHAEQAGEDD